jgi:UBX domain-containing protein 1/4
MKKARTELTCDDAPASTLAEPAELVPAEEFVDKDMLTQLTEMGFSNIKAARALHYSGNSSVEGALNWVTEHENDADLEEALMVPKQTPKQKLTAEEAKSHAAELLRKAKEKREAEERERERERELARVKMGKEMAAIARIEEEQKLKRIADERKREKEEEARAREKIRLKLEQDRRERRKKMGLPEELTPEEKEAERKQLEEKLAEEARRRLPVKPVILAEKMRTVLVSIKKEHSSNDAGVTTCFQTLFKMLANVARSPEEDKFRKVKLTNPAVKSRVVDLGGVEFLKLAGFEEAVGGENGEQILELTREKVDGIVLQTAGEQLDSALKNPFFGVL